MIKYDLNDGNDPDLHPPDLHHNLSLVSEFIVVASLFQHDFELIFLFSS